MQEYLLCDTEDLHFFPSRGLGVTVCGECGKAVTKRHHCPQELGNLGRQVNAPSYEKERAVVIRIGAGKASERWALSWELRACFKSRELREMAEETQGRWLEARMSPERRDAECRAFCVQALDLEEGLGPGSRVTMEE